MSENVKLFSYPEGFQYAKDKLDFLPEDDAIREKYLIGLMRLIFAF